jgi:hypothetical protein
MSVATQFSHDYSASTIYHQNVVLVDGQGFSFHRRPHHHHRQRRCLALNLLSAARWQHWSGVYRPPGPIDVADNHPLLFKPQGGKRSAGKKRHWNRMCTIRSLCPEPVLANDLGSISSAKGAY